MTLGARGDRLSSCADVAPYEPICWGVEMTEPVPRVVSGENIGQVDATLVPRYAGEATFARLPRLADVTHADAYILSLRNTIQSSSISNMVSEPSL